MNIANKILLFSFIISVVSSGVLYYKRYADTPLFFDGRNNSLLYSKNYYFIYGGDVNEYIDYHTLNHWIFLPKKSHTTRKFLFDDVYKISVSYYLEFYSEVIDMYGMDSPASFDQYLNPIGPEDHSLHALDYHHLQIVHTDQKVFCFSNLLTSSVKCQRYLSSSQR
ncbi:hypothetical protein [Vibrio sp.]|uniref:hypothetical protein n=1 Tax=Vibrio sp. TaxID=678 RepID=UPI00311EA493